MALWEGCWGCLSRGWQRSNKGHAWEGGIMKIPKKEDETLLKALLHSPGLATQDLWLEEQVRECPSCTYKTSRYVFWPRQESLVNKLQGTDGCHLVAGT